MKITLPLSFLLCLPAIAMIGASSSKDAIQDEAVDDFGRALQNERALSADTKSSKEPKRLLQVTLQNERALSVDTKSSKEPKRARQLRGPGFGVN